MDELDVGPGDDDCARSWYTGGKAFQFRMNEPAILNRRDDHGRCVDRLIGRIQGAFCTELIGPRRLDHLGDELIGFVYLNGIL